VSVVAEPIERKVRSALRARKIDAKLSPGQGDAELVARAVAAGIISESESSVLASQRELTARVIRVDDFAHDLGMSLLQPKEQEGGEFPRTRPQAAPAAHRAVA